MSAALDWSSTDFAVSVWTFVVETTPSGDTDVVTESRTVASRVDDEPASVPLGFSPVGVDVEPVLAGSWVVLESVHSLSSFTVADVVDLTAAAELLAGVLRGAFCSRYPATNCMPSQRKM